MNLTDYAGLKATVESWLMRPDLVEEIPRFIELAETAISRRLRTRQMVIRSNVVADSRYLPLPAGWRKVWNVQRTADEYPLDYLSPAEMDKMRYQISRGLAGHPSPCTYYSLFGGDIEFLPEPSASDPVGVELLYFAEVPPLTEAAPSNWLLDVHPDLYLYGALIHSAPFLREDERMPVWRESFEEAMAAANQEDMSAKRSGTPLVMPKRSF